MNYITFERLDELVLLAINQQFKQMKGELENLERQISKMKPETNSMISSLKRKIETNREYMRKAYEQLMDEALSKEEYLELKNIYAKEKEEYQNRLQKLESEEQKHRENIIETKKWVERFRQGRITEKQLTREVLEELIDRIYVYPEQKIEIYFKFAEPASKCGKENA